MGILVVLCIILILVIALWRMRSGVPPYAKLPPVASERLPLLGHSLAFFKDPLKLICENNKQHDGIFTVELGPRKIVLICNPKYKYDYYTAKEAVLSHKEALESFGFTINLRDPSNQELFEVMHSKLMKVNLVNNIARFLPDFAQLVRRIMHEKLSKSAGHIPDIFKFSQEIAFRAVAAFYLGVSDINSIIPNFVDQYLSNTSRLFSLVLTASVLLPKFISAVFLQSMLRRRQRVIALMTRAIEKVLQLEQNAGGEINGRKPYLTSFIEHVEKKASKAGLTFNVRQIADFAVSQVGSGAGGPTILFAQLLLFVFSSPRRKEYLSRILNEISTPDKIYSIDKPGDFVFLEQCIMETLRMISHTLGSMRLVKQPWVIGDYCIPPGYFVGVSHVANSYDEAIFPEPEVFNPDRWTNLNEKELEKQGLFTPFSGGSHKCPGRNFGVMLVKLMFISFLEYVDVSSLTFSPSPLSPLTWKRQALAERKHPCSVSFCPK